MDMSRVIASRVKLIVMEVFQLYASREILRRGYLPRSACQQALEKSYYRDSADSEWKHIGQKVTGRYAKIGSLLSIDASKLTKARLYNTNKTSALYRYHLRHRHKWI
jgi:hypothetical protein